MCGIYGAFHQEGIQSNDWTSRCSSQLLHRGPDASGFWFSECRRVCLGHRRLSIIDMDAKANQPMHYSDGKLTIVYNGEVYNFVELKAKLSGLGYVFVTSSDTEVVLAAYDCWGEKCLDRLNGMFAFVIFDGKTSPQNPFLFFARDRAGEKPFYYTIGKKSLKFASELKVLRPYSDLDINSLNYYLALGYVPSDLCLFKDIHKLPPGHCATYHLNSETLKIKQYWKLPNQNSEKTIEPQEILEEIESLIEDSVRLRLEADVPVGILLSGGLDSSIVAAAACRVSGQNIQTFNVSMPGSALDETEYAQKVAKFLGTNHHVLELKEAGLQILDDIAPFIDEPIADSSIIPSWLLFSETTKRVTVALGGDGGDELFGGYSDYTQSLADQKTLKYVPLTALTNIANFMSKLPGGIKGRNRLSSLKGGALQQMIWGRPYFDVALRNRIFKSDVTEKLKNRLDGPEQFLLSLFYTGSSPVDQMTRTHFGSILPDDFLVKVDRTSMAHSLEVRTPFLDHRLIELCFSSLPDSLKVANGTSRIAQKLIARKWFPHDLNFERKQGFSIPINEWIRAESEGKIMKRLEYLPDFFCFDEVRSLVRGHMAGRANGGRIFALIILSIALGNAL